eukprot:TRINITY_DN39720_c0_g1_i1.p1 TRINITY_DN39720_c0_g1~~TRINITY_DN39720_c0_g1_i1.p1  ORF type:complete len:498 (+),score=222.79 TRINITY_DN39720_c0_g1_i1:62-1495(+)
MAGCGGYTDMWRRQAAAEMAHADRAEWQIERVVALEEQVADQQRSIDRLSDGVADCSDRAEAAARLAELQHMQLQPLQRIAEQRDGDLRAHGGLRDELRAAAARSQRHDELIAALREEVAALAAVPQQLSTLHDTIAAAQREQARCHEGVQAVKDEHRRVLQQLHDSQRDPRAGDDVQQEVRGSVAALTAQMAHSVDALRAQMKDEISRVQAKCDARVEAAEQRAQHAVQEARAATEELRELRQVVQLRQAEIAQQRRSDTERASLADSVRGVVEEVAARVADCERQISVLRTDLAEHVAVYRSHLHQQTAASEETANAVQRMLSSVEDSRREIAGDLSGVRDWAARNMQRLKKRVELTAQELRQVQDGCSALSEAQSKQAETAEREQRLLRELLRQQTEKAGLLAEMVDRHVDGRRSQSPPSAVAAAMASGRRSVETPRTSPLRSHSRGRRTKHSAKARSQLRALLDDLARHDRLQ